jgi:acyl-CoA hydrolase
VRKGRFSENSSWKEQYNRKVVTADEAVQVIRNRDHISLTGGANIPPAFEQAMCKLVIEKNYNYVDVFASFMLAQHEFTKEQFKEKFNITSAFFGGERNYVKNGNVNFIPFHLGQMGNLMDDLQPRVFAFACGAPDEYGWMSRGCWGAWGSRRAFENPSTETIVVEVNNKIPYLCGDGPDHLRIHVSEVDYIVENNFDWLQIKSIPSTNVEKAIAGHIAEMIEDGSCLQLGQGGLADAIGNFLVDAGKKDIGIQSEVVTNSMANLMKLGIINNSKKNFHMGKVVAAFVVGDKDLWDFVDHNENFHFCEIEYVNNPLIIAKNDKVVSINNAMEVDLTGQVASEAIGPRQYTGTGGQFEWVTGAQHSNGGKSFIALNSTYKDKEGKLQSKIKVDLPLGSIVTTPRTSVQYIVTEYGVASMKFKSTRERAKGLINIAHPDFRDQLTFAAKKNGWL